ERSCRSWVSCPGHAPQFVCPAPRAFLCPPSVLARGPPFPPPPQYPAMPQPSAEAGDPADAAKMREFQEQYLRASQEYMRSLMDHFLSPTVIAVVMLLGINVGWAVFNLIPIPPLDGGRVLMEFIGHQGHRGGGDD